MMVFGGRTFLVRGLCLICHNFIRAYYIYEETTSIEVTSYNTIRGKTWCPVAVRFGILVASQTACAVLGCIRLRRAFRDRGTSVGRRGISVGEPRTTKES